MVKRIRAGSVKTAYKVLHPTKSRTVVILHGLRGDHQALLELAKAMPEFRVVIPDLPGHGLSSQLTAHTIDNYAAWFNDFLTALKLKDTVVIGHSYGANIVMAAIPQDRGQRIGKAIHFVMYPRYHNSGINRGVKLLYGFGKKIPRRHADKLLHSRVISILTIRTMVHTKDKNIARWVVDDGHRAAKNVSSKVIEDIFEEMSGVDMRKYINDRVPQMFIVTSEDKFSHNEEIKLISKSLKNSELVELDNLGHLAPLEDPQRLVKAIQHWLS